MVFLSLYCAQGQLVYAKDHLLGNQVLPVQLKQGMYVAPINFRAGNWIEKVVVE